MEFTKERTNIAKGLAILLMLSHHLYSFNDRLLNKNYYIPLIPSFNAELYIGDFGNICISMFLFLSGYRMFLGYSHSNKSSLQYSLGKLKDFYLTYWTYFLIFVLIGLIFFKNTTLWNSNQIRYSTDFSIFLAGFFGWSPRYNGEWWFVRTFVLLILFLSPLYLRLVRKKPFCFVCSLSVCF